MATPAIIKKLGKKLKNKILKLLEKWGISELIHHTDSEEGDSPSSGGGDSDHSEDSGSQNADEADFSKFDFCWGGFGGSKAKLDNQAVIKNLKVNVAGSKMTYSWAKLWGLAANDASGALACLFIPEGNKWIGGKFDWISESRTSRSLNNIKEGYNGWSWSKFSAAKQFAFVIVSKDGSKRTNVIVQK